MERQLTIKVIFDSGKADAPIKVTNDGLKTMNGSLENLANRIKVATEYQRKFTSETERWASAGKVIGRLQSQYDLELSKTTKSMLDNTRTSASMTMALQSMNFTIRDSPYFFRDFSLGILAVGNNLNPLIDSLLRVKNEAKAMNSTLGKELLNGLKGANGVIFAFSALVSVIQAVTFAMASYKSESEQAKDATDELADAVDKMSRGRIRAQMALIQPEIIALQKEKEAFDLTAKEAARKVGYNVLPAQFSKNDELKSKQELLEKLKLELFLLGDIDDIERRIAEKREIQKKIINDPERTRALGKEIAALEERAKYLRGDDPKTKKTPKEKDTNMILTNKEIEDQIKALELLRSQSKEVRNRTLYEEEINKLLIERWKFESEGLNPKLNVPNVNNLAGDGSTFELGLPILLGAKNKNDLKAEQKEMTKEMQYLSGLAEQVGQSMFQAFIMGKMGADEFLQSLLAIVAQMLIIDGLKSLFTGGAVGIFDILGFSQGGVVKASGGYMTTGNGSNDYIPAMLRPNELVLNPNQTAELFRIAKGIDSSGVSIQRVHVTGSIRRSAKDFVIDLKQSESQLRRKAGVFNAG